MGFINPTIEKRGEVLVWTALMRDDGIYKRFIEELFVEIVGKLKLDYRIRFEKLAQTLSFEEFLAEATKSIDKEEKSLSTQLFSQYNLKPEALIVTVHEGIAENLVHIPRCKFMFKEERFTDLKLVYKTFSKAPDTLKYILQ